MNQPDPDPRPRAETWVYLGRVDHSGKLYGRWRDESGTERLFAKPKSSYAIGAEYLVHVIHGDDNRRTLVGDPQWFAGSTTRVNEGAIVAAKLADAQTMARRQGAAFAKAHNGDLGAMTLAELRTEYLKGNSGTRAGMVAAVLRYLEGAW